MSIRVLVLRTAGINCDEEAVRAFQTALGETPGSTNSAVDLLHLNAVVSDPGRLEDTDILVVPGGFSYGDDVAAGRVYGVELRRHLDAEIRAFVDRGGFVLGICNGFQVLVELGLFEPDRAPHERTVALTDNASNTFEARWVTLRAEASACDWLEAGWTLPCPVAHGEGRFVVDDPDALARLEAAGQVVLRYVDPEAAPGEGAGYPANPNGSVGDIAGICDPTGRVVGLMPHPERNLTPWNHPLWTRMGDRAEGEGVRFFRQMVDAAAGRVPAVR